jgi:site-specific DNA-cytosine methylase
MRLLELFSGTGSVRKAVGDQFDEVVSIDILQKFNPTETADILTWDYKKYPPGYFDVIWASPPCTEYSIVLECRPDRIRDIDGANKIVEKTVEIINYFNPTKWFIENPQTGLLKEQEVLAGVPFYDVDYCKYSNFGYRKRTRIWTNVEGFNAKLCQKDCENMVADKSRHMYSVARTKFMIVRLHQRYAVPAQLIKDLFECS